MGVIQTETKELQAQIDELSAKYTALVQRYREQVNSAVVILGACEIDDIASVVAKRLDVQTFLKHPKFTCRRK